MDTAARARQLALVGIETRATQSASTGSGQGSGGQTAHEPAGSSKGGQFTSSPHGSGLGSMPSPAYKPSGGGAKKAAAAPANTPQPPATPRTMKVGDSGEDVRYAQYAMSLLGFKVDQSGNYDQATADAVKQIQQRLGAKKPNGHLSSADLRKLQDAVRLSPCIGGGQRDLAFEAQWEERDLEDVDNELDEDTEALIEALGEFIGDDERSFTEALHPRNPKGSVGGGRFRSIVDRVVDALSEWKKGNGPDDPLKDFNREQLLKAAKAHGHTFRRGASIEEIKAQILDDVRNGTKAEKAAAPHLSGAPADHRRFTIQLGGKIDPAATREVEVENKIRAAYEKLRPNYRNGTADHWLGLADLREAVPDVSRRELDAALIRMGRGDSSAVHDSGFHLIPIANSKALKPRDRAAEVLIGGEGQHAISFEDASPRPLPKPSGTATDVGIFGNPTTGKLSLYRESDTGKRSGRAIKSFEAVADPAAVREVEVENKIRAAYRDLARSPHSHVMLADLRERSGVPRADFDATLLRLSGGQSATVHLAPEEDRRRLTPRLREAAIFHGGEDMHSVSFEDSADRPMPQSSAMASLESWARDNGHTELADYAKAEQARTGGAAKVAKAAPGKRAPSPSTSRKEQIQADVRAAFDKLTGRTDLPTGDARPVGNPDMGVPFTSLHEAFRQRGNVFLADIRDELGEKYNRKEVDAALEDLATSGKARLIPAAAQHGLAQRDRDSAVRFGDANYHMIHFGDTAPAPRDPLAGLEGLTPVQKRAALRKRGLGKAEIDALAPLGAKPATGTKLNQSEYDALSVAEHSGGEVFGRKPAMASLESKGLIKTVNGRATITDAGREAYASHQPSTFDPQGIAEKISGSGSRVGGRLDNPIDEAAVRQHLAGLNVKQLRRVASEFGLGAPGGGRRGKAEAPPAGSSAQAWVDYLVGELTTQPRWHWRSRELDLLGVTRALGHDVTPGHDELHHYWTVGEGRVKWVESPKPWTTLVAHLTKYVGPLKAKTYASRWFHEVFGFYAGSDLNRVTHGQPPRGHRIGPG